MSRPDAGFTLVELLVVSVILPLVIGAAATAIFTTLKNDTGVSGRLSDSHDAQITSAYFTRDVQSAASITTAPGAPVCGTGTQVLGLSWALPGGTAYASYVTQTAPGPVLVRNYCSAGVLRPTSTLSEGVSSTPGSVAVALTCVPSDNGPPPAPSCSTDAAQAPEPSLDVETVQLQVTEASGYQYNLTASPRNNSSESALVPPGSSAPTLLLLGSGTGVASCGGSGHSPFNVNGLAAVDSASANALTMAGSDTLNAADIYTGDSSTSGATAPLQPTSAYTTTTNQPYSSGPPIPDPYASLPDPSPSNDASYNTIYTTTNSLPGPGVYQNAVTITSSMSIPQGIYIFEGGLTIQGPPGATLTGNKVLFFIGVPNASASTNQTAAYTVAGNGAAILTPDPSTQWGQLGVAIFQSRTDANTLQIAGNGTTSQYGVIYAPDADVSTFGNGGTVSNGIVANSLSCGGNGGVALGPVNIGTTTSVTSSSSTPLPGQQVTFTATVSASDQLTPAGTVSFTDTPNGGSATALCSNVALVNGQATCSTSSLTIANSPYTITATFSPPPTTTMFAGSFGTMSQSVVPTVPGPPTALAATAGNAQVSLTWTAPASNGGAPITSYTVLYGTNSNGPFNQVSTGSASTSYTVTGLTNGVTYFFEVEAVNTAGAGSPSNQVSSTPFVPTAPSAPTNVVATRGNAQVALTWTAPPNGGSPITDYKVLYATNSGGPYTTIDTMSTATSYTVTGLTNGTLYYFEVEATNNVGTGPPSSPVSATPATKPGSPTCPPSPSGPPTCPVSPGKNSMTISWVAPANNGSPITDYQILYSTSATGPFTSSYDTQSTATTATVPLLQTNKQYYFEIVAVNAVGAGPPSNPIPGHTTT